jgi:hypothetical protein
MPWIVAVGPGRLPECDDKRGKWSGAKLYEIEGDKFEVV